MKTRHRVLVPASGAQVKSGTCALAVMTKAPRAGRVKTRLTPPLTPEEAAALNSCFLRDTASSIAATSDKDDAQGVGVYTPAGEESAFSGLLPEDFVLVLQRGEKFGERLVAASEDLLRVGFDSFCLINSDSPTVPQSAFARAVEALAEANDKVILGPSDDGGYYLIGMKKLHRRLFEEIDWSTERVFEQTLARAAEIGVAVELLPTWYDVDDRATLRRLCEDFFGDVKKEASGFSAPATRNYLARLLEAEGRGRIWPKSEHDEK